MEYRAWAGTTYGNQWMHRWLIAVLRHMDVRLLYIFAALFIVPVCLVRNPSYGIIYRFFRQRIGLTPVKAFWNTYINHCMFSQNVIDKFAMYAGKKFRMTVINRKLFDELENKPEAFMMLSSHIGNYELAGYTLKTRRKRMNAIVYGGEKALVMAQRSKLFANGHIRMIAIKDDMSHLFEINGALANSEIVSMPADRTFGSKRSLKLPFLGAEAEFPLGPLNTATMRKLDVIAVNVMKTSAKGYTIYVTPLTYDKAADRQTQIRHLAESYIKELELRISQYPTQWYNYFEFWKE